MSLGSEPQECPECGRRIPTEAPQGLCPNCLLQQAALSTETGQAPTPRPAPPSIEEVAAAFPQLEILELIGRGGMGFVFKARQRKLNRLVALKILSRSLGSDPAFAERFAREGQVLARLNHPNIVTIHDFGQAHGLFYLLMEYVDGVNLRQAMKAGRFSSAQALAIVPKICEALQFAHNESILHRDIKPENILLDTKGRVKIADFGIAKILGQPAGVAELSPGPATATPLACRPTGVLGTPEYMAPEQVAHPQGVDQRADIYSLGVVFYEMLTGELPIGDFATPSRRASVDPAIDDLVRRALQRERARRPYSAEVFRTQVETISAALAVKPSATSQARTGTGRVLLGRWKVAGLGIGLVLLLAGAFAHRQSIVGRVGFGRMQGSIGSPRRATGPVKTVVLQGSTNSFVTVSVRTDSPMLPGETLLAEVKLSGGKMEAGSTRRLSYEPAAGTEPQNGLRSEPQTAQTEFYWSFGTAFGYAGAEDALRQIRQMQSEGPLRLNSGEPFELFSVTNRHGGVMTGFLLYTHSEPVLLKGPNGAPAKAQATVTIGEQRDSNLPNGAGWRYSLYHGFLYTATVPPGYSLRAKAQFASVFTTISYSAQATNCEVKWYPQFSRSFLPNRRPDQEQRAFEEQLKHLLAQNPIHVIQDEPLLLFSITNASTDEVLKVFLELLGPTKAVRL